MVVSSWWSPVPLHNSGKKKKAVDQWSTAEGGDGTEAAPGGRTTLEARMSDLSQSSHRSEGGG